MISIKLLSEAQELHSPRRVMKHILILCTSGKINLVVDESNFLLSQNTAITITSGQIHYMKSSDEANGIILEFTYNFFCKTDNDIELIFHNGLFCHFAMNEIIFLEAKSLIETELLKIQDELINKPYQYTISIHSRIELILVELNRFKLKNGDEIWKPGALFLKFLEAVRNNYAQNFSVKQIADTLNTTENILNKISKTQTGKTAQNVIYGLIVSEAKRLLTYEKLSIKEVAYELGFNDPFYFSNFLRSKQNNLLNPSNKTSPFKIYILFLDFSMVLKTQ
jgi:AraC-like DNA-binding protein